MEIYFADLDLFGLYFADFTLNLLDLENLRNPNLDRGSKSA